MSGATRTLGLLVAVAAAGPGCFSQDATLGLPCATAHGCGRQQDCVDGTCQKANAEPVYCPLQEDVVALGSDLPVFVTEFVPTNALDVMGECGSLGGDQAVYLWRPPISGTFAARLSAAAAFFATDDILPPIQIRNGGCQGDLEACALAAGSRSFNANQDDVVVLAIDNLEPGLDPEAVGLRMVIDEADYCLTGGELASTVPIVLRGTTAGSENLLQPPACENTRGTGYGPDVAFSWTAPSDGLFAFTASSDDDDVLLYVLGSTCGGPTLVCSAGQGFTGTASGALDMVRNQTVVIVVDTFTEGSAASFELSIDEAFGCVPNDNDLGFQFPPGGLVVESTDAEPTSIISCAPAGASQLLYRWTAPAAAFYTFSTAGSDAVVTLSVLEDSCSGAVVGCDLGLISTPTIDSDGVVTLPLDTGTGVVLAAAPEELVGQVVLSLTQEPCGSELLATPLPISQPGEVEARVEGPLACDGNRPSPEDAVFSWRAPDDGTYEFEAIGDGSAAELLLYVQDQSCAGHTLACDLAAAPKLTLAMRAQQTVAVGVAAPPGGASSSITLMIRDAP